MRPPTRAEELAVLRAVIYASLFDYPLTLEQLAASLGVRAPADAIAAWWRASALLQSTIEHRDGWYFPAGRGDLIETRARREALSRALLTRDRVILGTVSNLPFVRMVALSGSLAHLNAEGSADLDLFVITAPDRVWLVTVTTLVIARLRGWRKRLCLNYVVSEAAMGVAPQDLFSANQIIHLRPVTGSRVFRRFITTNGFVREFYPNFDANHVDAIEPSSSLLELMLSPVAPIGEHLARALYGWHLRRRAARWQSRDQVKLEPQCLKLHTSSHRATTLSRFENAMLKVTPST